MVQEWNYGEDKFGIGMDAAACLSKVLIFVGIVVSNLTLEVMDEQNESSDTCQNLKAAL